MILQWIMNWRNAQCDGCWESDYGITIETCENPGWGVKIDILDTELEGKEFSEIRNDNGDNDWMFCYLQDGKFQGYGDTFKLEDILTVFKEWAERES
ncbi:MAG: immunity 53 family protein [Defluviitaleaceae bacterium]|nr:immunity 53 family protein [Defluviitaleaceae bacterium]MCL2263402.1 immunity 53 family protein [Defluviitaleaceae bacterium]